MHTATTSAPRLYRWRPYAVNVKLEWLCRGDAGAFECAGSRGVSADRQPAARGQVAMIDYAGALAYWASAPAEAMGPQATREANDALAFKQRTGQLTHNGRPS